MLVALEPGTYPGPWGMRVERIALITETGCEILSRHDLALVCRPRSEPDLQSADVAIGTSRSSARARRAPGGMQPERRAHRDGAASPASIARVSCACAPADGTRGAP